MAIAHYGRLVRQSTKAPLIGVTVEAIDAATGLSGGSAVTDSQGFFSITALPSATYFGRPLVPGKDFSIQPDVNTLSVEAGTIGGWTIDSTSIRNAASTVMLRGAANLAFGATPPTSATVGTGIFIDSGGIYGLNTIGLTRRGFTPDFPNACASAMWPR